ncbi:hypothetical protein ABK040_016769 [Willaertia magna]
MSLFSYSTLSIDNQQLPIPVTHLSSIYSSSRNSVIIFGGEDADYLWTNQLMEFSLTNKTWTTLNTSETLPMRDGHQCCLISDKSEQVEFILYGGSTSTTGNKELEVQLLKLTIKKGAKTVQVEKLLKDSKALKSAPPLRRFHSMIYNDEKKELVIFGGRSLKEPAEYYNDLYTFNLETKQWKMIHDNVEDNEEVPSRRAGHSAVFDRDHSRMIVFGGFTKRKLDEEGEDEDMSNYLFIYYNDTYSYCFETNEWSRLFTVPFTEQDEDGHNLPTSRERHQALINGKDMLVLGGWSYGGVTTPDFLYKLNLDTLYWTKCELELLKDNNESVSAPESLARYGHTCELANDKIVIFGGRNCTNFECLNEILVFDSQGKKGESKKRLEMAKKPKMKNSRKPPTKTVTNVEQAMKENAMRFDSPKSPKESTSTGSSTEEKPKKKFGLKNIFNKKDDKNSSGSGLDMQEVLAQKNKLKKTEKTSSGDPWKSVFK